MYQIGICDDEPDFLKYLSVLITRILLSLGISCRIHTFRNVKELTDYFSQENPPVSLDLLLLNPVLEKENSLQLAEHLRKNGTNIPVISVTNNMKYPPPGRKTSWSLILRPRRSAFNWMKCSISIFMTRPYPSICKTAVC